MSSTTANLGPKAATSITRTLFNLETGKINSLFKKQLDLVGIVSQQHFTNYDAYHILNVNQTLQGNGCFQTDYDFYKKGGVSAFKITYDQAKAFLDEEYSTRETLLPETIQQPIIGIMASGVFSDSLKSTLYKRLNGLKTSIDQKNLRYETVYVLCKDQKIKELSEKYIDEEWKKDLPNITFHYIISTSEQDVGLNCLIQLAQQPLNTTNYVVISDGTFADRDALVAQGSLKEANYCGLVSVPITDWKIDMNPMAMKKHCKA